MVDLADLWDVSSEAANRFAELVGSGAWVDCEESGSAWFAEDLWLGHLVDALLFQKEAYPVSRREWFLSATDRCYVEAVHAYRCMNLFRELDDVLLSRLKLLPCILSEINKRGLTLEQASKRLATFVVEREFELICYTLVNCSLNNMSHGVLSEARRELLRMRAEELQGQAEAISEAMV